MGQATEKTMEGVGLLALLLRNKLTIQENTNGWATSRHLDLAGKDYGEATCSLNNFSASLNF